jgi:hypothetical protein
MAYLVRNPDGGKLLVRTLPGASEESAVAETLRAVYSDYGDKPVLGRLLRNRRDRLLSVFFEVKAVRAEGKPYLGLIIVAPVAGGQQVAVILDETQRFPRTEPQMLRTLFGGREGPSSGRSTGQVPQLVSTLYADRSASIGLAPGWKISKSSIGQGVIDGPHGSKLLTNIIYNMVDPRSPNARYNPQSTRAPWGTDLAQAWLAALPGRSRELGLPLLTVKIASEKTLPPEQGWYTTLLEGIVDRNDGLGPRELRAKLTASNVGNGTWTLYENSIQIPQDYAQELMPTARAMYDSYRIDNQVIGQYVQGSLQQQQQRFADQQARYRAQQASNDAQHASYWSQQAANAAQHNAYDTQQDTNSRQSQQFSNYLLDQTVVSDDRGRHGTVSNAAASALIQAFPNEFQEVPSSQYLQNIDYSR